MTTAPNSVRAYVGLGSNLGDRESILEAACREIDALPETTLLRRSRWFENPAVGIEGGGNDFLNGVVEIETALPARALLEAMLEIERNHGRIRSSSEGHQNRTLDLDLLLYGDETIEEEGLVVPHPEIANRDFVKTPLRELGLEVG